MSVSANHVTFPPMDQQTAPLAEVEKVAFLCIGAQKSGTSWLNGQLKHHPDVCMPPIKECHYFNFLHSACDREWIPAHYRRPARQYIREMLAGSDEVDWETIDYYVRLTRRVENGDVDESWYHDLYSCCDSGHLRGDITPAYLNLSPEGIAEVYRYNPQMRLIALLREPISRSISAARMLLKCWHKSHPDRDAWESVLKSGSIIDKSLYANQLDNWLMKFPHEQLLVLPYEQIAAEPDVVMNTVCDFLDLPRMVDHDWLKQQIHKGKEYTVPEWVSQWLEQRLADDRTESLKRYPQLAQWWEVPNA